MLPEYIITSIAQQNDTIWVGTRGDGLFCIDRITGQVLKVFTKNNGLPDDVIYGILNDKKGKIWFSTNKGISFYNIVQATGQGTFNHYTRQYGLQHDEFNIGAYSYEDKD
ncbi:MAG: two-component regulator propeller domain-containing protein [Ferruginibacter sp.]